MDKHSILKGLPLSKQISFTAMFAALCCASTLVLTIPLPASGYFNVGDVFVLLSAWCLGPLFGCLAAGLGSALADVLSGFVLYAPATLIIKGLMAFIAYMVWAFLKKFIPSEKLDTPTRTVAAILSECVMVLGYFLFESMLYGTVGALPNVLGNCIQGTCCLILASILCTCLYHVKPVRRYFPFLVYTPCA